MNMTHFTSLSTALGLLAVCAQISIASAQGFSTTAPIAQIDATAYGGVMVYGNFGNPGGCTVPNRFFLKETHPQFKLVYAMLLTAVASRQPVSFYAHSCEAVLWYSVATVTYNTVSVGSVTLAPGTP